MQVQNRFQPVRFGGPNTPRQDFTPQHDDDCGQFSPMGTDYFDGQIPQEQIRLPEDPEAHQKLMKDVDQGLRKKKREAELLRAQKNEIAQHKQNDATLRMRDKLAGAVQKQETERTALLNKLALPAFKHSLLTEKNHIIEQGGVKNENWDNEKRKLKHPPKQVQNLGLESLLSTDASTFSSWVFDWKVNNLYFDVMGDMYHQKPDPAKQKTTWTSQELAEHTENLKTQKQIEQEMEQFIKDKLAPQETALNKTREEAQNFQELHQQQAHEFFQRALSAQANAY